MVAWEEPIGVLFTIKKKSFYFDGFGGQPVKFLLSQIP